MKASIGRTVIVHGLQSNGAFDHPAVITRAWSSQSTAEGPVAVNLTVFPDNAAPQSHGTVMLYHDEHQAHAACMGRAALVVAHWPSKLQ